MPTPKFSDESGLSSELYQAQTDNSWAGDGGQGLMHPGLSSELYQDSSNLDPERRPSGYGETDAHITLPYVIHSEDPLSQALDNSDDDPGEPRTVVWFTHIGREVKRPLYEGLCMLIRQHMAHFTNRVVNRLYIQGALLLRF